MPNGRKRADRTEFEFAQRGGLERKPYAWAMG